MTEAYKPEQVSPFREVGLRGYPIIYREPLLPKFLIKEGYSFPGENVYRSFQIIDKEEYRAEDLLYGKSFSDKCKSNKIYLFGRDSVMFSGHQCVFSVDTEGNVKRLALEGKERGQVYQIVVPPFIARAKVLYRGMRFEISDSNPLKKRRTYSCLVRDIFVQTQDVIPEVSSDVPLITFGGDQSDTLPASFFLPSFSRSGRRIVL